MCVRANGVHKRGTCTRGTEYVDRMTFGVFKRLLDKFGRPFGCDEGPAGWSFEDEGPPELADEAEDVASLSKLIVGDAG